MNDTVEIKEGIFALRIKSSGMEEQPTTHSSLPTTTLRCSPAKKALERPHASRGTYSKGVQPRLSLNRKKWGHFSNNRCPTRVVQRRSTVVIADPERHFCHFDEKGGDLQQSLATGQVQNGLAKAIAALEWPSLLMELLQRCQVLGPYRRDNVVLVGVNLGLRRL